MRVLAVDPGRQKCGIAACVPGQVLAHRVVPATELAQVVRDWMGRYRIDRVVMGAGTGARGATEALAGVPFVEVDEVGTTLAARARYFADHPPRGWKRLVPRTLLTPAEPYDDYVAILLAEAYLAGQEQGGYAGAG